MPKFKIIKRFSLDFIAPEWKEAYINFYSLTIADVREVFPKLAEIEEASGKNATVGLESILSLLKAKFVDGMALNEEGEITNLKTEDLDDLPITVLSRALTFLSQDAVPTSPKQ